MVKRYDADGCQSAIGHYVSWDDYAKLKAVADVLADEVDKFEVGERAFLEQALFIYRRQSDDR